MTDLTARLARVSTRVEFPTLALAVGTYAAWAFATVAAPSLGPAAAICVVAVVIALHSSLQHEAIHGHPFRSQALNEALVFPALGLLLPYGRFRDQHLAHHRDPVLTDPYDDPESNYLDPAVWARVGGPARVVLGANNTLLGRMILGPPIGTLAFWRAEIGRLRRRETGVARAWILHLAGVAPVALWLAFAAEISVWQYLAACWLGLSLLRIRTFAEHRAHERHGARSVIIEDRGPLSLLFLNNNFHAVHHAHPKLPWYSLPAEYDRRRETFLARNGGYRYASYKELFARHLFRRKDPVPHPLWTPPEP